MKVSEASDEELNRFIANVFEPEPTVPDREDIHIEPQDIGQAGVWFVAFNYDEGDVPRVAPLDFIRTGGGLKMMLERLLSTPATEVDLFASPTRKSIGAGINDGPWSYCDDLGRAVAEAFALANGWKEA